MLKYLRHLLSPTLVRPRLDSIRRRLSLAAFAYDSGEFIEAVRAQEPLLRRVLGDAAFTQVALDKKAVIVRALGAEADLVNLREQAARCEFDTFTTLSTGRTPRLALDWADRLLCLDDRAATTPFDRHYTYHPAWAARVLAKTKPAKHVDISSILAFSATASAFVPMEFYDFRPAQLELSNLAVGAADLTNLQFADGSIESLSCMHVIEHIGLGRYGDPLDPDGDLKAIRELVRVLAPGGNLLIATPVGRPRIQFNAHRIYDHEAFASYFRPLELVEFTLIREAADGGGLVRAPSPELVHSESYACGCFWFRKAT